MFDAVIRRLAGLRDDTNAAVAVNVGEPDTKTEVVSVMSKKTKKRDHLTDDEVEKQEGEPLPERTQMSILTPAPPGAQPVSDDLLHLPIQPPNDV
jgi:hypothetical protein